MIRVLVVDDSAYVRKTLGAILGETGDIEVVGYAGDGQEALEQVRRLQPDVVTVDLEMPVLDGVGFIDRQMRKAPLPIVVVSSVDPTGELAGASMRAGAAEFVLKPTRLANSRLLEIGRDLVEKIRLVAEIPPERLTLDAQEGGRLPLYEAFRPAAVVVGLSTGGPQLLHAFLPRVPKTFPLPIAVVIHMPVGFTGPLAERLDATSKIEVLEAEMGMEMRPGRCVIARAGQHLRMRSFRGKVLCDLSLQPAELAYRPSVDVLFESASQCYGSHLLGLVLTGMGHEGRGGAAWVKAAGGRVYTQTEDSSVVWGMPRAVKESGFPTERSLRRTSFRSCSD